MGSISIEMEPLTREIGLMTYSMERARKFGPMAPNMRANFAMAKSRGSAFSLGVTGPDTRGILERTILLLFFRNSFMGSGK